MKPSMIGLMLSLVSFSSMGQTLNFSGQDGKAGQDGQSGRNGRDGDGPFSFSFQESKNGQNGSHGGNASSGTSGRNGREVVLNVKIKDNLVILSGSTSGTFKVGQRIVIDSSGGDGGNGGDGGDGGRGGDGGDGKDASSSENPSNGGDGGDGGDAGPGGDGGDGGDAGNITVNVSPEDAYVLSLFEFRKNGGAAGQAGSSGSSGNSGSGGSSGNSSFINSQGQSESKGFTSSGSRGRSGSSANDGRSGRPGANGRLLIKSNGQTFAGAPRLEIGNLEIEEKDKDGRFAPSEEVTLKSVTLKNKGSMPIVLSGANAPFFKAFGMQQPIKLTSKLQLRANETTKIALPKGLKFNLPDVKVEKRAQQIPWSADVAINGLKLAQVNSELTVAATEYLTHDAHLQLDEKKRSGHMLLTVTNTTNTKRQDLSVRVKKKGGNLGANQIKNGRRVALKVNDKLCDEVVGVFPLESNALDLFFDVSNTAEYLSSDVFEVELVKKLPSGKEIVVGTDKFTVDYGVSKAFQMNIDKDVNNLGLVCSYGDGDKLTVNNLWVKKVANTDNFVFQYEKDGFWWNFNSQEMQVNRQDKNLKPFITKLVNGKPLTKVELSSIFKSIIIPRTKNLTADDKILECH